MKHTQSEITAIKKLRSKKLNPKQKHANNKSIFCKSYFGGLLQEIKNK